MPGPGALPKAERSRSRDTAVRDAATNKLTADGVVRGPELPDGDWHPRTVAWWQTWRESAQAQVMAPTDWDALAETAILHTALWNGDTKVAGELRLRVAKYGATMEDRLRLRIAVEAEVKAAQPAQRGMTADRRKRLLKVVERGGA